MFQHSPHGHDSSAAFQSWPSHQECGWLPRGGGERPFLANKKQVVFLAVENGFIELDHYLGICCQWLSRGMLSGPAVYVDHDDDPNAVYVKQSRTKVQLQVYYIFLLPASHLICTLKVIRPIAANCKITVRYAVDERSETRQRWF